MNLVGTQFSLVTIDTVREESWTNSTGKPGGEHQTRSRHYVKYVWKTIRLSVNYVFEFGLGEVFCSFSWLLLPSFVGSSLACTVSEPFCEHGNCQNTCNDTKAEEFRVKKCPGKAPLLQVVRTVRRGMIYACPWVHTRINVETIDEW